MKKSISTEKLILLSACEENVEKYREIQKLFIILHKKINLAEKAKKTQPIM